MVVKPFIAQMSRRYVINCPIIKSPEVIDGQEITRHRNMAMPDTIGCASSHLGQSATPGALCRGKVLGRSILEEGVGVVAEDAEGVVAALSEEAFHGFEGSVHLW